MLIQNSELTLPVLGRGLPLHYGVLSGLPGIRREESFRHNKGENIRGDPKNFDGRPMIPTQFVEDTMVFHKDSKDATSHPPNKDGWRGANWRGFKIASY